MYNCETSLVQKSAKSGFRVRDLLEAATNSGHSYFISSRNCTGRIRQKGNIDYRVTANVAGRFVICATDIPFNHFKLSEVNASVGNLFGLLVGQFLFKLHNEKILLETPFV